MTVLNRSMFAAGGNVSKFPDLSGVYNEFRELLDESDGPTSWIEFWEEIK